MKIITFFLSVLFTQAHAKECHYSIEGTPKFTWTGYKFTEKVGVNGSFDEIQFKQDKKSKSLASLMKSITFDINTASINSNSPLRDKKLALFIFGPNKNAGKITGMVSSFSKKKAFASITMNDTKRNVLFEVKENSNKIELTGKISLTEFNMLKSLKAIGEACKLLHTGQDGVSKTWDEVGLKVEAAVSKSCK